MNNVQEAIDQLQAMTEIKTERVVEKVEERETVYGDDKAFDKLTTDIDERIADITDLKFIIALLDTAVEFPF